MIASGIEIGTSLHERAPVFWPWRRDGELLNGLIEGPVGSGKTVLLKRIEDAACAVGGWNVVHYDASRQPRRLDVFADTYLVPERSASAGAPTLLCIDEAEYLAFEDAGPVLNRIARAGAEHGVAVVAVASPGGLDRALRVEGVAAALRGNHVVLDQNHPHITRMWTGTANGVATLFHPAADSTCAALS